MTNIKQVELKQIMNIALEFRLSLKNICRFLGVNQNEANQKLFYDEIMKFINDSTLSNEFKFLVYETAVESEQDSKIAYNIAKIFYLKSQKEVLLNKDRKSIMNKLFKTDCDYYKLKTKGIKLPMSDQDALIISKYRIKHAIPKEQMAIELEVHRVSIDKWENRVSQSNPRLGNKLSKLNEYNYDLSKKHFISKSKRKK